MARVCAAVGLFYNSYVRRERDSTVLTRLIVSVQNGCAGWPSSWGEEGLLVMLREKGGEVERCIDTE